MNKKILFIVLMLFWVHISYAINQIDLNHNITNATETRNATKPDSTLISERVEAAKVECSEKANAITKKIFKDFNEEQYSKHAESAILPEYIGLASQGIERR
jgi:hypothetical protein